MPTNGRRRVERKQGNRHLGLEIDLLESETEYTCNNCGESIVIPVDWSQGSRQEFVEDCPVCCSPNLIRIEIAADGQIESSGDSEQDLF